MNDGSEDMLHMTAKEFLNSRFKSFWIDEPPLRAFLRKTVRLHPDTKSEILVLDIANVTVSPDRQDQGVFATWLSELEPAVRKSSDLYQGLYVENVLTERFADFFRKMRWTQTPSSIPCFFHLFRK